MGKFLGICWDVGTRLLKNLFTSTGTKQKQIGDGNNQVMADNIENITINQSSNYSSDNVSENTEYNIDQITQIESLCNRGYELRTESRDNWDDWKNDIIQWVTESEKVLEKTVPTKSGAYKRCTVQPEHRHNSESLRGILKERSNFLEEVFKHMSESFLVTTT